MRCKTLLTMLLVNILLANITEMAKREIDPRHKPGGVFCKANRKSSQMGPKAVTGATTAKEAQTCAKNVAGQQVQPIHPDQPNLTSKETDADLAGKKQQLDQLLESLDETRGAMEKSQRSIVARSGFMKSVCQIRDKTRQRLASLQGLYQDEIDIMRRMVVNARQLVMQKRSQVDAAKHRLEELHTCLKKTQAVLHRNRDMARKASCSAAEARKRIGIMPTETDGSSFLISDFLS